MYKYLSIVIIFIFMSASVQAGITVSYGVVDIDSLDTVSAEVEEDSFAAAVANESATGLSKSGSDSSGPTSVHQTSESVRNLAQSTLGQKTVSENIAETLYQAGKGVENLTEIIRPQNVLDKISEATEQIADDSNDELDKLKQERTLLSAAKYGVELVKKTAAQLTGGMATMIGHPLETAGAIGGAINGKLAEGVEVMEQYARGEIDAVEVGAKAVDATVAAADALMANNSEIAAGILLSAPLAGIGKVPKIPKTKVGPRTVIDVDSSAFRANIERAALLKESNPRLYNNMSDLLKQRGINQTPEEFVRAARRVDGKPLAGTTEIDLSRVGRQGYSKLGADARDYSSVEQLVLAGKDDVAMKFIKQKFPNTQAKTPQEFLRLARDSSVDMTTVRHGSSSTSLIGSEGVPEIGVVPRNRLKNVPQSGEGGPGASTNGVSQLDIVSVGVGENGKQLAKEYTKYATKWNPKIGRENIAKNRAMLKDGDYQDGSYMKTLIDSEIAVQEARIQGWDKLSDAQRRMAENPYPVIYEGKVPTDIVYSGPFRGRGMSGEVQLPGGFVPEGGTIYVPANRVQEVYNLFKDRAGAGKVKVLPIEEY